MITGSDCLYLKVDTSNVFTNSVKIRNLNKFYKKLSKFGSAMGLRSFSSHCKSAIRVMGEMLKCNRFNSKLLTSLSCEDLQTDTFHKAEIL